MVAHYVPRQSLTTHGEILDDEICIYEWTGKRVHALNATAARVWNLCDGTRSVTEIAEKLRQDIGNHADDVVRLAVIRFSEAGLLETPVSAGALALSRRGLVKRLGLTAAMLPIVSSIAAPSPLEAQSANTRVFTFSSASQTFVVPAGVTQLTLDVLGGAGDPPQSGGGGGGRVTATIPVTPGETLTVNVGGAGSASGTGGFNGGGQGGGPILGGDGGGASDVRRASTRLVIAGGGGGRGIITLGGKGGGTTGGAGMPFAGGTNPSSGGGGGTPTAGGAGGTAGFGGTAGTAGSSGLGGNGGRSTLDNSHVGGGGGGGGYFGGGGGAAGDGGASGGGGGSSYADPAATNVTHTQGVQSGDGRVTLTW